MTTSSWNYEYVISDRKFNLANCVTQTLFSVENYHYLATNFIFVYKPTFRFAQTLLGLEPTKVNILEKINK